MQIIWTGRKNEGRNNKDERLQSLGKRVVFPQLHLAVPLKAGWFTCSWGIFGIPRGMYRSCRRTRT